MWSVAKPKLYQIGNAPSSSRGEQRVIGTRQSCVVISVYLYREKIEDDRSHDGRRLIAAAAR